MILKIEWRKERFIHKMMVKIKSGKGSIYSSKATKLTAIRWMDLLKKQLRFWR